MSDKKVYTGWVGKNQKIDDFFEWDKCCTWEELIMDDVFKIKGTKSEWAPESWPPRKVKITVEFI